MKKIFLLLTIGVLALGSSSPAFAASKDNPRPPCPPCPKCP
jgi:hypothetical protein